MKNSVLEVDRAGLARKLAGRPKAFVLYELVQNAWDEASTRVDVTTEFIPLMRGNSGVIKVQVLDDSPDGFTDLRSVYTLFRDSKKADDPTQRGRFELGEKLVIALADFVRVETTTGTVTIDGNERVQTRHKLDHGTRVTVRFSGTRAEYDDILAAAQRLAPPKPTTLNGAPLAAPAVVDVFQATLETVVAREGDGALVKRVRTTDVQVYRPPSGERGWIYELGIPVVETDDPFSYDVQQRVPVNWERNSVPQAFLRALRVAALNRVGDQLEPTELQAPWVTDALADSRCEGDAVKLVVRARFGERAVSYDPSDHEGSKLAASQGYTVVPGGALPGDAWKNVRRHQALLPAGQVTPSPKVYSEDGEPEHVIPRGDWTADMGTLAIFAEDLGRRLIDSPVYVVIVNEPHVTWRANFGKLSGRDPGYRLCLNYGRLGKGWFALRHRDAKVLELLVHEFAHAFSLDHLSSEYHEGLCRLAARMAQAALEHPELDW